MDEVCVSSQIDILVRALCERAFATVDHDNDTRTLDVVVWKSSFSTFTFTACLRHRDTRDKKMQISGEKQK